MQRGRLDYDYRDVRSRHEPRHSAGSGAKPRRDGNAAPARRGAQHRRCRQKTLARYAREHKHHLARQEPRQAVFDKLCNQRDERPPRANPRSRRLGSARPARIQHAHLAQPRQAFALQYDALASRQSPARAEQTGRRGQAQSGADCEPRLGVRAYNQHEGAFFDARRIRRHHNKILARRKNREAQRRRTRGTRLLRLHDRFVPRRQPVRGHFNLPASRNERARSRAANPQGA